MKAKNPNTVCMRGKLNRMFKYFKGKVFLRYEYNNSLGEHLVREGCLTYDQFEIRDADNYWHVILSNKGKEVWNQEFDSNWEFTGLGSLEMCNSGPYCYFFIRKEQGRMKKVLEVLAVLVIISNMNPKTIKKALGEPYWLETLCTRVDYRRQHDDHDGQPKGGLMVMFDEMGDAYISTDNHPWLRFRTWGGGGRSLRTRNALMILAEAIRLDNKEHPQEHYQSK